MFRFVRRISGIMALLLVVFAINVSFAFGLTYQQEIGVNFTFNPALNLTVSADLYINNLAPGAASDSNVIDVVVATNAINGYTLTANVGNNTTYNTRNLVHSNSNLSNTFTSIAYSATPTITTNTNLSADTWGFSYSTNNGSTWSNYNGLPLYSDTTNVATLKETTGPVSSASGDDVKFKIAAKASASQVSGAYNNVINFNLAANVVPQYTVSFNANTGSGTMPTQTIFRDEATMLAPNSFTPPSGFFFTGWNTAADGSGTSYTNQESVTNIAADGGSITLYAQWGAKLYDIVASMSKGKQTAAELQAVITEPTSSNPATDTSNSGVYEYNASVFGTASDASNEYPIYYYRGILDSSFTYYVDNDGDDAYIGSTGNGGYYPNYVKLENDTCWRIIRTTGSGGVKLLYNGVWNNNTCANYDAGVSTGASVQYSNYSDISATRSLADIGYTLNTSARTSSEIPLSTIFGNNSNIALNSTRSNIKTYLEDTWYYNNMLDYTSILEPSAGYCNDRSFYDNSGSLMNDSFSIQPNYDYNQTGLATYYFGARYRYNFEKTLTLTCLRGDVDLYRYVANSEGGGNELKYPVALPTFDELSLSATGGLMGTGFSYPGRSSSRIFVYSNNIDYWTLSPGTRGSTAQVGLMGVAYYGEMGVSSTLSKRVRPVISLVNSVMPASGSGTATDPWVVNAPPKQNISTASSLQDVEECPASLTTGQAYVLTDSRDGTSYHVAKLADGKCWMLDNLMLDLTDSTVATGINSTNTNADNTSLDCLLGRTTGCTSPHSTAAVAVGTASTSPRAYIVKSHKDTTPVHYGVGNGKTGIYYNSCAASAGTYCYSFQNEVDVPDTLYDYGGDICPVGWHIPTGNSSSGEFKTLYGAYSNSTANLREPFAFTLSGIYNRDYQNPPQERGDMMYLWTSTFGGAGHVYYAGAGSSLLVTNYEMNSVLSIPVRCVFGESE